MDFIIYFFRSLNFYPDYFMIVILLGVLYFIFIAPLIFKFWIIPKIEMRYGVRIRVSESIVPFANWGLPAFEIPVYVFFKYIGIETWGMKNPLKATYLYQLKKINYDTTSASRAEKIVSFISLFFLASLFISCLVFGFYLYAKNH